MTKYIRKVVEANGWVSWLSESAYNADELRQLASTLPEKLRIARDAARAARQPERAHDAFIRALKMATEHFPLLYAVQESTPANDRTLVEIAEEKADALTADLCRLTTLAARLYMASQHSLVSSIWKLLHLDYLHDEIEKGRPKIEEQIWLTAIYSISVSYRASGSG